jgi:hypothetical protein
MSADEDGQALVDRLDAVQAALAAQWAAARKAGDADRAKALGAQADRAADQLVAARQSLLAAIDGGQDVTDLLAQMARVSAQLLTEQAAIARGQANLDQVVTALDGVDNLLAAATAIGG